MNATDRLETEETEKIEEPEFEVVGRMSQSELEHMNAATLLLELAKQNLSRVWQPVRVRYNLPEICHYDRANGDILREKGTDG